MFAVRESSKGRGLYATRCIAKGTTIHLESPLVAVTDNKSSSSICGCCFSTASLRCSRCSLIRYCSRKCQKLDWRIHREECDIINRAKPNALPTFARTIIRILILLQIDSSKVIVINLPSAFDEYNFLI